MDQPINFPARFIIDEFFIKEILKDKNKASKILLKLSRIHSNSKHYPLTHNIIFDESFRNAIADKKVRGPALIGAMHPIPYPDFVQTQPDFESKLIKQAINLASKKPYNVFVLTSAEQAKKYLTNSHYAPGVVQPWVKITHSDEALKLIDITFTYVD